jgi:hypothetical protein
MVVAATGARTTLKIPIRFVDGRSPGAKERP